ncbi:MAG: hypothetical protein IKX25_09105 [Bacteroidales bacterium]|nr:hypothetical protein [Bacteroidales bacterium]
MKHLFTVFLPLILGQLFVACKHGNPEVGALLDRIEQVVVPRPDSALIELVRLDSLLDAGAVSIEGERQMARYALLKTQTHDKNWIDDTNDSLILRAVRYYDEHGSKREQMLSHYYHGAIFRNAANFSQAYSSFLLAAKLATDYGDNTYAGLSYGNVSCICRELYSGESLYYADLSYQCHQATGDTARINWALMLKGIALNYQKRYPEAESIFDYLLHSDTNAVLRQEVLPYYIYQCVSQHQYQRADSLIHLQHNPRYPVDYMSRAIVCEMKGQQNEADSMMQFAARLNSTATDKVFELATIATLQNNREEYYEASQTLFHRAALQDSIVRNLLTASVSNIQSNYELQQKELAEYRYAEYKRRTILASALSLLLIGGGIAYTIKKKKERQRIIETYMENVSDMQRTLLENTDAIATLQHKAEAMDSERLAKEETYRNQIKTLFAKSFHELESLYKKYYQFQNEQGIQREIYKDVCDRINAFAQATQQEELDHLIDENFDHAMEKVKSPEFELSDKELQLYKYKVAGLSARTIRMLMHIESQDALQKRQQRLRKKILESKSPFATELASLM